MVEFSKRACALKKPLMEAAFYFCGVK